jgi:alpha-2-macroglobulin-like protein
VTIGVSLRDKELAEGGVTEANVTVTNRDKAAVPTPVAIVGIPGGLEVRHDRLKELVKSKRIDAYEVIGREVVLYWRTLDAGQTADVSLSLVATVPGTYTAPASRVYLYYTDEFKQWAPGVRVTITPTGRE